MLKSAPGNPVARQAAALRTALLGSIDAEDLAAIAHALIKRARAAPFLTGL